MEDHKQFERDVAQLFRDLGAEVQHDVDVGGNQIDVLVTFRVVRIPVNIVVECKYYNNNIGVEIVNKFIRLIEILRGRPGSSKIDFGLIISKKGFTREAKRAAAEHPIYLLTIDDIISYLSGVKTEEGSGLMGSEAYIMIDAINGIKFDENRSLFWRLFDSVCKARKWSPEVDQETLWSKANTCSELAKGLGDIHRAAAYMLQGILYYDKHLFTTASEKFSDALAIATRPLLKPIVLQALFWQARCLSELGAFEKALEILEEVWKESKTDAALANFMAKVGYWRAKVYLTAHNNGKDIRPIEDIKSFLRDSFHLSDKLGIINYREGARARLGEISLEEENYILAFEELLKSYELTPNPQDRRKLEQLINRARANVPAAQRQSIEERVQREVVLLKWAVVPTQSPVVQVCDYAVWRFAKFRLDRILQHINRSNGDWISGVRHLLEDDEVFKYCVESDHKSIYGSAQLSYLDTLKYRSLRAKLRANGPIVNKSALKHRLRMCRRLLFSSVLINDTGKRGSLSLVPLSRDAEHTILEKRDFNFVIGNGDRFSCKATSKDRLPLTETARNTLRRITSQLSIKVFENTATRGIFPISIDFLIEGERFYLLEFHYPSRGFVVLYEPFRDFTSGAIFPIDIYAKQINEFVKELGITSILLGHNDLFQDDSTRPRSEFYSYEFQHIADSVVHQVRSCKVAICSDWRNTTRKQGVIQFEDNIPDIVILDDIDPNNPILSAPSQVVLPLSELVQLSNDRLAIKNLCIGLEIPTPPSVELPLGAKIDFNQLKETLGDVIVIKERFHLPSWHEEKRRCEFLDLTEAADRARLTRWVEKRDLLAEKIITASLDNQGHFGELRVHACVMV